MIIFNDSKIATTIFPDNTSQVWKIPFETLFGRDHNITWEFENEAEFLHLNQLVSLLNNYSNAPITLNIPYFPYARQDKEISVNNTFALIPFCKLLSTLKVDKITTLDLHSDIAFKYINNLENKTPDFNKVISEINPTFVCFPDKGSMTRYSKYLKDATVIYGDKIRDQLTGHITKYEVINDPYNVSNSVILIIDDICDGGMTFKLLAKELQNKGVTEIHLYITHGIFSNGIKTLRDSGIKRIFTHKGEINE